MRSAVFLVGGLETIVVAVAVAMVIVSGQLTSGEQLSRELGFALVMIFGLPYLACVAPALLFAYTNQRLPLALVLCGLFPALAFVAFFYA